MNHSVVISSISDTTALPVIKTLEGSYRMFTISLRVDPGESAAPVDLSSTGAVYFIVKGTPYAHSPLISKEATIVDAANGIIELELLPTEVVYPGLWQGAFQLRDIGGWVTDQINCRVFVEKSITSAWRTTPVTVNDIRSFLIDRCPEDNKLLMSTQFTDDQIMNCIALTVEDWNSMPPNICTLHSGNFPWRSQCIGGTAAFLLRSMAINQIRNNATFNTGTVTVNDSDKGAVFKQIGDQLYTEWRAWAMAKKREINISNAWGSTFRPEF